ncbi:hypothetical protein NQZ68_039237 [Dissostichus eleginoides]|nr:hypothetical protein NQZ68_039237 [Dissostichus eleginoides]
MENSRVGLICQTAMPQSASSVSSLTKLAICASDGNKHNDLTAAFGHWPADPGPLNQSHAAMSQKCPQRRPIGRLSLSPNSCSVFSHTVIGFFVPSVKFTLTRGPAPDPLPRNPVGYFALPEKHERPLIGSCGRPATLPYLTGRTQQRTTPGYYISSESLE